MGKKGLLIGCLLCCILLLAGCGENPPKNLTTSEKTNMVLVKEDGTVESLTVEDFSKDDYDEDELKQYINDSVSKYNASAGEGAVALTELSVKDGKAKMLLSYQTAKDFSDFNGMTLEVTAAGDAASLSGMPDKLTSIKNGDATAAADAAAGKKTAAVSLGAAGDGEEAYTLIVPGKITYYNGGTITGTFSIAEGDSGCTVIYEQ